MPPYGVMTSESHRDVHDFEVKMSREAVASSKKTLVYVGGLDEQVTPETLQETFITFGEIAQLTIPGDAVTGKHRGFAFIEFEETEDATAAMVPAALLFLTNNFPQKLNNFPLFQENMNDAELFGRVLKVNLARPNASKFEAVWQRADKWLGNIAEDSAAVDTEIKQEHRKEKKEEEAPKPKKPRVPTLQPLDKITPHTFLDCCNVSHTDLRDSALPYDHNQGK